ncbi:MAG: hypothetical protein IPN94_09935 [Sphingobacteriales bacterium]|nr:hypothetical protein [Sphingobacteriales bacterium]
MPTAGISITESGTANDGTVCAGSAITLTATGGTSYNWTLPMLQHQPLIRKVLQVPANAGTYTLL